MSFLFVAIVCAKVPNSATRAGACFLDEPHNPFWKRGGTHFVESRVFSFPAEQRRAAAPCHIRLENLVLEHCSASAPYVREEYDS